MTDPPKSTLHLAQTFSRFYAEIPTYHYNVDYQLTTKHSKTVWYHI